MKTNIMRYSMQLAMLKQLLVKKLITEKEYRIIQQKLMNDYNISNNIICDNHSQENKKTLADIVFGRTNSAAYIHRTDDLL